MLRRFRKLVAGLRKFMKQANKKHAVLGLSGGVDSALVLKIAVEALGPRSVTALIMPNTKLTNPRNTADAEAWAQAMGIPYFVVAIDRFLKPYEKLPWGSAVLAAMNLNARVRAILLYHFANAHDAIVLGTSNKTELKLGYFTKYGDGACDAEVIGDLFKTEVWKMAETVGIPKRIIRKTPSAELRKGQTDEGEMGVTYHEADRILKHYAKKSNLEDKKISLISDMMIRAWHKQVTPPTLRA